jgi:hypothetical protein
LSVLVWVTVLTKFPHLSCVRGRCVLFHKNIRHFLKSPPVSVNHVLVSRLVCTLAPWIGFGNILDQSTGPHSCTNTCRGGRSCQSHSPLSPGVVFFNHLTIIVDIPSTSSFYFLDDTCNKKIEKKNTSCHSHRKLFCVKNN